MKKVLGVDPGNESGAFAILTETRQIAELHSFTDWNTVGKLLARHKHDLIGAVVEAIATRPHENRVAACSFCGNYGGWQALVQILGIKHAFLPPIHWQPEVAGRRIPKGKSKETIAQTVMMLWPREERLQNISKKKLYGYTDALGIALRAYQIYFPEESSSSQP